MVIKSRLLCLYAKGSIYRVEEPFDDAPREGQFDWKGFARNLVAGLALGVACVVLSVATGGLAGAVLMGAGVSVLMTTASMSISDYESGNVRSWEEAQLELTVAEICGAITGAVAFWAEGAFEGVKFLMSHPMVRKALIETISGTVDVVTGLMTRASEVRMDEDMTGEEKLAYIFDWGAIGVDFFTGMVIDFGVGGLKWLDGRRAAKKAAQEAAERAAKEAAEEAAERAAKEAAEETAERAAKEAAEEAAERATHNTTGELMDDFDEYEQFYEDLFDRQGETFGEYDDFLDDLKELQRGELDGSNTGSLFEGGSKTNWEAHNVVNYAKLKEQYRVSELANDAVDSITQTGALPNNYITKSQARAMGWSEGKALNNYAPGKAIGGDVFANTNDVVPSANGRVWYEADVGIDYTMSRSNPKNPTYRILYSNDGLIYGTYDHYDTVFQIFP